MGKTKESSHNRRKSDLARSPLNDRATRAELCSRIKGLVQNGQSIEQISAKLGKSQEVLLAWSRKWEDICEALFRSKTPPISVQCKGNGGPSFIPADMSLDGGYFPEACEIVEALGMQGMSAAEISVQIGADKQKLKKWAENHPEFAQAMVRAKEYEQGWWERKARENLENGRFNANLWYRASVFRFPEYQEIAASRKIEVSGNTSVEVSHSVAMDTARRVMLILEEAAKDGETLGLKALPALDDKNKQE